MTSKDGTKLIGAQPRTASWCVYDAKSKRFLPYLSGISAEGVAFTRDARAYVAYPEGSGEAKLASINYPSN